MRSLTNCLRFGLFAAMAFAFVADVNAATYFVRTSGNDGNTGRSAQSAFKTIQRAAAAASAGDTVYIGAGEYKKPNLYFNTSGAAGRPIRFIADTNGNQTGDAGSVVLSPSNQQIEVRADHVSLEGFTLRASSKSFMRWKGDNGEVSNCTFRGGERSILVTGDRLRLTQCSIANADDNGIEFEDSKNSTVTDCEIFDNGDNGIRIEKGSVIEVNECVIRNNGKHGIEAKDQSSFEVSRSRLTNNGKNGAIVDKCKASFVNCLIAFNDDEGVEVKNDKSSLSLNLCTIVYNGDDGVDHDGSKGEVKVGNCIIAFNDDDGLDFDSDKNLSHRNNLLYGNRGGNYSNARADSTEIEADPRFLSATDFRLKSNSPAIDKARTSVAVDLAGTKRPLGAAADIGCYEGGGVTTSNYYVSTRGNDDNDGRSSSRPFRTIGKAAGVVEAGDKVFIAAGTYQENAYFRKAGTAVNPIRFIAQGNVVWQPAGKNQWSANLNNADHTIFENIHFSGANVTYGDGWAYGLHNYYSEIIFRNCEFEKMLYGSYNVFAGVWFDGCKFHDGHSHSLRAYYGGLRVSDCEFKNDGNGPLSYRNHYTYFRNTTITGMKGWSLQLGIEPYGNHNPYGTHKPTFDNCTIKDNANGLILSHADNDDSIDWKGTRITNTKGFELYLQYCDLKVTPQWRAQFPIEKGGSGLYSYGNKLDVEDMKFEDYAGWGFLDYYSELTMQNVSIKRNRNGMQTYGPKAFLAKNCDFTHNKGWGLLCYNTNKVEGKLQDCLIDANLHGLYLSNVDTKHFQLANTVITNNSGHGLYLRDSDSEFTPKTMGTKWRLANNGHGITTWGGKALFDGIKVSGNTGWGALTYYTDITVKNSSFVGNGSGFLAYYNKAARIGNSHFDDNKSYGMQLNSKGNYYGYNTDEKKWGWWPTNQVSQLRNSTMRNNGGYGLHLSGATERSFQISGIELTGNKSAGLYATHSELVFDPKTMSNRWKIADNGSHIYAAYGKYQFRNLDFSDAKNYGVYTWYSDVDIENCNFERNGSSGFRSYYNKSLTAKNSKFNENKNWGMHCYHSGRYYGQNSEGKWGWQDDGEPAELTGCSFEANGHGLYLNGATDKSITLVNTPINNNNGHGLYAVHCDLTFSPETVGDRWQINNNGHGITTYYGKVSFDRVDITGSRGWGALTYYSDVRVRDSKFTGNGSGGLQSYFNKSFKAKDTDFVENGSWGVSYYGNGRYYGYKDGAWAWQDDAEPGKFINCLIADNKSHGMHVSSTTDDSLIMENTPIKNNPGYGLYAVHSDLKFTKDTVGSKWQISDNGHGICTYYGKALFDGVEIADNKSWGVLTHYGDVTVRDSTFTRNGYSGFRSYYNKSFAAQDSTFSENGSWGLMVYGNGRYYGYKDGKWAWQDDAEPAKLVNCDVVNNTNHGLYLNGSSDETIEFANTNISNNPGHGIYAVHSDLKFTRDTLGKKWNISGNGHGITTYYGKVLFDGVTIADNKGWGALSYYADTTVKNSTFTRNGSGGVRSYYDRAFEANNSVFNENGSWGLYCYSNGRYYGYKDGKWAWQDDAAPAKFTNCEFAKNKSHGVGFNGINDDRVVMSNCEATENGSIGIYFANSTVTLTPESSGKWVSKNNGHGFHATYSNITMEDFEVSGNKGWGMYAYYSNVSLKNAKFSGNGHNMYWYAAPWAHDFVHKLTVEGSVFENSTGHHGLLTYYGLVDIKNSKFRNNKGDGLYTAYNKSVTVENSEMTGNGRWGIVYHVNYPQTSTWSAKELFKDNVQTLTNVKVDGNRQGVYVYNAGNANFGLKNTDITNNQYQSIYYNHCDMLVDDQQTNKWTLANNGYGPYAVGGSDITFRNVVNTNSKYHGFLNNQSKVSLENCVSTGSQYGYYQYRPTAPTSIKNSRFDGNNDTWAWGLLSYGGGVDSMNNVFNGFYNGAYVYRYGDEAIVPEHTFYNNTFADLRYWGIHVPNNSKATAKNNILAHRSSDSGGYGLGQAGSGVLTHSHNLVFGFAAPFYRTDDPNDTTILKNPRFADLASGDVRLAKGSPAINSGTDLQVSVPYDMEGNARPSFKVFEMGAYEYTSGAGAFRVIDWNEKK